MPVFERPSKPTTTSLPSKKGQLFGGKTHKLINSVSLAKKYWRTCADFTISPNVVHKGTLLPR